MRTIGITFVLVVVAACGKKDTKESAGSGKVASCNSESLHSCVEYRDANLALGTDSLEKLCTAVSSSFKFTQTACPTANVIGTCKRAEGKDFYYQGYELEPVADLEKSCTSRGGTFGK
jgi:hypothetical protein